MGSCNIPNKKIQAASPWQLVCCPTETGKQVYASHPKAHPKIFA